MTHDLSRARLSVLGLGYVGCVSAACFAAGGHAVVGVDVDPSKTALLARGVAPIVEERIGDLVAEVVADGRLTVGDDLAAAVADTDVSLVCVGTPSGQGGRLSTEHLERVSEELGLALADKDAWHTVVFRSTMLPGTCEGLLVPLLEKFSGKQVGVDFGVCVNPEFLREGSSVSDFYDPPKTVVGQSDDRAGDAVLALYDGLPGPRFRVGIGTAEMTKYVDNSFHALKVGFANEIGAVCSSLGVDSHEVSEIFLSDTKLNVSPAYLRPGFAFGGSCLPKDVRALTHVARTRDVEVPILDHVLPSNLAHLERAVRAVVDLEHRDVGMFGLTFKAGTDDLRESPLVELAERLVGKGFDLRIFDAVLQLARLVGSNRAFVEQRLPHLAELMTEEADEVAGHGRTLVVGAQDEAVLTALTALADGGAPLDVDLVDLVRLPDPLLGRLRSAGVRYHAIAW
ncbi:nucleotide sugar dehydrogenase [Nocardioides sp. CFH 31398]|uniref:nucleotide sugar dehydrogenase n=1 Tax=Nocardioides sp. CFH 31398 TaxID=2919579 RepID=UPI001F06DFB4|nr:nucleotide sugar dehydrogenase [Nocardioides sp. CFH 31398]MCH1867673.1 nucleotide sugar dehydrogenase [Nocardioides sp. CFH 31398]